MFWKKVASEHMQMLGTVVVNPFVPVFLLIKCCLDLECFLFAKAQVHRIFEGEWSVGF